MGTAAVLLLVILSILLGLIIGLLITRGPKEAADVHTGQRRAQAYLKGVEYLLSNDHDAAIAVLTNLARSDTESVETYFALGSLFRQKGEYARGIQIHQNLLARPNLDPDTRIKALLALGRDYQRAGLLDKAATTLDTLLGEVTDHVEALEALVEIHARAGAIDKALIMVQRLQKIDQPVSDRRVAGLYVQQARSWLDQERYDKAKKSLKKAHEFDAASPEIPLSRAAIHRSQGKPAQELEALLEAVALAPPLALEYSERLVALTSEDLPVLERVSAMADERENDPFVSTARARLLIEEGQGAEAEAALRAVINTEPRLMAARRLLADILLADRDPNQRKEVEDILAVPNQPLYSCTSCSHSPPTYTWHCPACRSVGSVVPVPRDPT